MGKNRLEAFSDGVLAIIITIMVLELKVPHGGEFAALTSVLPVFLSYVLSFIYVGIYWNNHHHLLHSTKQVSAEAEPGSGSAGYRGDSAGAGAADRSRVDGAVVCRSEESEPRFRPAQYHY